MRKVFIAPSILNADFLHLDDEIKKVDINEQKLNQMKKLIISAERENIKTGEFTTQDMVFI